MIQIWGNWLHRIYIPIEDEIFKDRLLSSLSIDLKSPNLDTLSFSFSNFSNELIKIKNEKNLEKRR